MYGLGTLLNAAAIVLGGILGMLVGKLLKEQHQNTLTTVCGISVLFIGISGALEGMLRIENGQLVSQNGLLCVVCLALGAFVGELLNIEGGFERFGQWLKKKTGNSKDSRFVDGFVTASFTVCIGAMAIVGAIEDALSGDISILAIKSLLDLIIIIVITGSMGKGCAFSAIPVLILQGTVTALAVFIKPWLTDGVLSNLSTVGNILIFCVGVNLVWDKKVKVANLLPALLFAVAAAFLPI